MSPSPIPIDIYKAFFLESDIAVCAIIKKLGPGLITPKIKEIFAKHLRSE